MFRRSQQHQCFQLGVLHCTVEGQSKADRYAPCSLDDLKNSGLDAWALGHVHERATLSAAPFVAYSGNAQGLHISFGSKRENPSLIAVEHIIVCTGQEPQRALQQALLKAGVSTHIIGGADVAAELDAKRAIAQGSELGARL